MSRNRIRRRAARLPPRRRSAWVQILSAPRCSSSPRATRSSNVRMNDGMSIAVTNGQGRTFRAKTKGTASRRLSRAELLTR